MVGVGRGIVGLVICSGFLVAACTSNTPSPRPTAASPAPRQTAASAAVLREAPSVAPAAVVRHHACTVKSDEFARGPADNTVTLDSHPDGATLVWIPGFGQRPCEAVLREMGAAAATALRDHIMQAPRFPEGVFHCPFSDAVAVAVYFTYDSDESEYVKIQLSGCAMISAPGRRPRSLTASVQADLRTLAPPAWRSRIHVSPRA
jgi:hypothetical protein